MFQIPQRTNPDQIGADRSGSARGGRSGRFGARAAGYGVEDTVRVRCPYCREWVDLYIDPDTAGALVEDCAVCCRPWAVTVERDGGRLRVHVSRAQ